MSRGVIYGHIDPRCVREQYATEDDYLRSALAYVGATVDPANRLKQHLKASERPGRNRHYQWLNSLTKLGLTPKQIILAEVSIAELAQAESNFIRRYLAIGCRLTNHRDEGGYVRTADVNRPTTEDLLGVSLWPPSEFLRTPVSTLQGLLDASDKERERINTDTEYRARLTAKWMRFQELCAAAKAEQDAQRARLRKFVAGKTIEQLA